VFSEIIRLLSAEGQPTNAVLTQTCTGVFFIRLVFVIIFEILFLPKPSADCSGPLGEPPRATGGLRTTVG